MRARPPPEFTFTYALSRDRRRPDGGSRHEINHDGFRILAWRDRKDGGVPLAVVLNYSHGERRAHRIAQAGCATSMLSTVIWGSSSFVMTKLCCLVPSSFRLHADTPELD
jgi:hypothetical protein